jgi:hypothetical protein
VPTSRTLYPLQTEEVQCDDNAGDPAEGAMRYNGDSWQMTDATGVFNPRPSNAGEIQISTRTQAESGASYVTLQEFNFRGSDLWGTPQTLEVIASVVSGIGSIRVRDITNSLTIAENTNITNTTTAVVDLGTISNVPAAGAVWAIQALNDSAVNTLCESLTLDFFLASATATSERITLTDDNTKISHQAYYIKLYGPTEFPGADIAAIGTGGAGHPDSIELSTTYT